MQRLRYIEYGMDRTVSVNERYVYGELTASFEFRMLPDEWEEFETAEAKAEELAKYVIQKDDMLPFIQYDGTAELDGGKYRRFAVKVGCETLGMIYADAKNEL